MTKLAALETSRGRQVAQHAVLQTSPTDRLGRRRVRGTIVHTPVYRVQLIVQRTADGDAQRLAREVQGIDVEHNCELGYDGQRVTIQGVVLQMWEVVLEAKAADGTVLYREFDDDYNLEEKRGPDDLILETATGEIIYVGAIGEGAPEVDVVRPFFNHPGYVETCEARLRDAIAEALDLDAWRLEVGGLVGAPLSLTHAEVVASATDELVAELRANPLNFPLIRRDLLQEGALLDQVIPVGPSVP